ncbi:MAG: ribosome maturation factor RimP [Alphaproteobacteria bacterium]|nr:ribosome maturation factor RimP [Alphaproteobacteria bacterium]
MTTTNALNELIEPVCVKMGYDVVRILLSGGERRKNLQVMIERKDRKNLTVEDCEVVSRALSPILDEADPIEGNYSLEVSSPGIDRPLVKKADFERFKGDEAKIETSDPIDGRKRFNGELLGVEEDDVLINFEGNTVRIPYLMVAKAKLILTDKLLKKAMELQEDQE